MITLDWCQHHVMLTAPLMVLLHSLGQDAQNNVKPNFFAHVTPLGSALALCNVVNGTGAFLGQYNQNEVQHMMPSISSVSHSITYDNWNKVQHHYFGHLHHWHWCWHLMMPTVLPIAPTTFLRSRHWCFWSCHTNHAGMHIMWRQQHN